MYMEDINTGYSNLVVAFVDNITFASAGEIYNLEMQRAVE